MLLNSMDSYITYMIVINFLTKVLPILLLCALLIVLIIYFIKKIKNMHT